MNFGRPSPQKVIREILGYQDCHVAKPYIEGTQVQPHNSCKLILHPPPPPLHSFTTKCQELRSVKRGFGDGTGWQLPP
jgi:hypothetical protein